MLIAKRFLLTITFFLLSSNTNSGVPVADIPGLIQDLLGYAEQLEQGINQLESLKTQYEELENTKESLQALTGAKNISDILNNPLLKDLRRQIPMDTRDVIEDLAEGKLPKTNSEFKRTLGAIYKLYPSLEKQGYYKHNRYKRYENEIDGRHKSLDVVKLGSLHTTIDNSEVGLDTIEGLIKEIDKTDDLKASVDLNTRMLGEIGLQINQLIKLYSTNELVPSEQQMLRRESAELLKSANDLALEK